MFSPRHLLRSIQSFQLGYNPWPQHPYPGRWTTPTVIFLFALLTAFITCINVPLSAYEFIEEVTYRPNDTLPALPLSRWLPSLLQPPTSISFQPQVLTVGDTLQLNNSLLNFTLTGAYDRTNGGAPVSTFSYFNNPFSGCDISNMSIYFNIPGAKDLPASEYATLCAQIDCDFPMTRLTMTWEHAIFEVQPVQDNVLDDLSASFLITLLDMLGVYLGINMTSEGAEQNEYTVIPACLNLSNPNIDSACLKIQPPEFRATSIKLFSEDENTYYNQTDGHLSITKLDSKDDGSIQIPGQSADNPSLPVPPFPHMWFNPADVSAIIQNMFQMMFHYLRLQMGVVHPNLIYASAEMYNRSILPVGPPPAWSGLLEHFAIFNRSRTAMANETYFAQMQEIVHLYNTSDPVPVMEYSRTVPKLKPLGSAITSVFVSTFAMLSTIWAVFSLLAGALAKMYADRRETKRGKGLKDEAEADFRVEEQALSEHGRFLNDSTSDALQDEMESMKHRLKLLESYMRQMQLAFRRRGVPEEEIIGEY